jgi:hypothetical protein
MKWFYFFRAVKSYKIFESSEDDLIDDIGDLLIDLEDQGYVFKYFIYI